MTEKKNLFLFVDRGDRLGFKQIFLPYEGLLGLLKAANDHTAATGEAIESIEIELEYASGSGTEEVKAVDILIDVNDLTIPDAHLRSLS